MAAIPRCWMTVGVGSCEVLLTKVIRDNVLTKVEDQAVSGLQLLDLPRARQFLDLAGAAPYTQVIGTC